LEALEPPLTAVFRLRSVRLSATGAGLGRPRTDQTSAPLDFAQHAKEGGKIMLDLWNVLNDVMRADPWFTPFSAPAPALSPTLQADVAETDAEYWITAELPGVPLENVQLSIDDDVLTMMVDKRQSADGDNRTYHHVERRHGTFSRAFRLPKAVDREQVQATMKDGVLSVRLPKAEHARPRRIPVRVASLGAGEAAPRQIAAEGTESTERS
jgi:HSP20 family protein